MAGAGMIEICSELQNRRRGNRVIITIIPFAYDIPFAGTRLTTAIGWSESCRAFFEIPRFISTFRGRTDGKLDQRVIAILVQFVRMKFESLRCKSRWCNRRRHTNRTADRHCHWPRQRLNLCHHVPTMSDQVDRWIVHCFYLRIRRRFRTLSWPSDQVHRPPDHYHRDPWTNQRNACKIVHRAILFIDLPASRIDIHMIGAMTKGSGFHTIGHITVQHSNSTHTSMIGNTNATDMVVDFCCYFTSTSSSMSTEETIELIKMIVRSFVWSRRTCFHWLLRIAEWDHHHHRWCLYSLRDPSRTEAENDQRTIPNEKNWTNIILMQIWMIEFKSIVKECHYLSTTGITHFPCSGDVQIRLTRRLRMSHLEWAHRWMTARIIARHAYQIPHGSPLWIVEHVFTF